MRGDTTQSSEKQTAGAETVRTDTTRRLRRRILIVLACMVVFVAVAVPLVNRIERGDVPEPATFAPARYNFEEPDYDYDILRDEGYLGKNRTVLFSDPSRNYSESLDNSNRNSFGEGVTVLDTMISCLINGDTDGYNRLFTKAYIQENGTQARFTMQQLYDIVLTRIDSSEATEDGKTVVYQKFYVEYKIRLNNGTYRTDIGHDESRKQVVVLCNRDDGRMLIDQMYFPHFRS